jgi:hypothetical protein
MKESNNGGWSTDVVYALYKREEERLARGECPECGTKLVEWHCSECDVSYSAQGAQNVAT